MLTMIQALDHATDVVARAMRAGADGADAVAASSASTQVAVRLGQVESIERSESSELGLRVFVGTRSASASTSDLSSDAIAALVERTTAMARLAPEDPWSALAPAELLAHGAFERFEADDGIDVDPAMLRTRALAAEDAARAVAGVTNSEGGGASHGTGVTALATSISSFVRVVWLIPPELLDTVGPNITNDVFL